MLDFFQTCTKETRGGVIELYPDFNVGRSKDLMIRGQAFYAVWNEKTGLWSTDEYDVRALVDEALSEEAEKLKAAGTPCSVKLLRSHSTNGWSQYKKYLKNASDSSHQLDTKVTFANTEVKKTDYVSRRLPYNLASGSCEAWDELVGTLYSPTERAKIEWAIGSIISGDSKKIEKFLVFYGPGGTGKSTMMKIIQKLFGGLVKDGGYVDTFVAKDIVGNNNAFSTEAFKNNPLVAINHDGDLSKIDDNSKLNSIASHDEMTINEKYKSQYTTKINAFLFMGTNKPVKITDGKSGLIRRVIDVMPTGVTFEPNRYYTLMEHIEFELGAIAQHCLNKYREMGKNYYNDYQPTNMMMKTDVFFNFIEEHFDIFKAQDGTTLKQAWELYKEYAEYAELGYKMKQHLFREELKNYFNEFHDRVMIDGSQARSVYKGFTAQPFTVTVQQSNNPPVRSLVMEETTSIFDEMYTGLPAQYANSNQSPQKYWDDEERVIRGVLRKPTPDEIVDTVLGDLDTSKLHFVNLPEYHIIIDFDLKVDGKKSLQANLEAASSWPHTYAEISKSGNGVHLHYIYDGDTSELASKYSDGIEVKVYTGNASLRRKLTLCNNVAVATITGGLPFREKKTMLENNTLKSEQGLRRMIIKNLKKEIHPGTKSSIDFIEKILSDAKKSGMTYDVTDMYPVVMAFAANSTNQADVCLKTLARMREDFKSEEAADVVEQASEIQPTEERLVFFDCEVYPNLFAICWKFEGEGSSVVQMLNPAPVEVEQLLTLFKLVGFNNRGYDNHIMWARMQGATNEELYKLSQRIIVEKDENARFGKAWSASYADVYDFSSEKKSLKKWEIELGVPHVEMDIPWDKPVPKNKIQQVLDYCTNDVLALEAVFNHCKSDFQARQILADLSGLTVNSSTRQHAIRIMFGKESNPQKKFVYTDLSEMFPGYVFNEFSKTEKSIYRDEVVGEGGYVYAEPGIYENVALLDIASMHPTSIEELNLFGPYTPKFSRLKNARLAIKHANEQWKKGNDTKALEFLKEADELLPGVEVTEENAKPLSDALKLVINSIYGYTSAKFDNPFRDKRNKDNIVAKRGALFMIDLKKAVQEQGFTVAHIKTDSIKIPNATPDIIAFVAEFGAKYGYTFEHEATYEKFCLVNDAVYVAKKWNNDGLNGWSEWTATGAQFQHPYVFKTLFSGEPVYFKDLCETKQVKEGAMYLRFPEGDLPVGEEENEPSEGDTHVGRSGSFVPINPDQDIFKGGDLLRIKDRKEYAISGTKGYKWAESEMIKALAPEAIERMVFVQPEDDPEGTGGIGDVIDMLYYNQLAEDAVQSIERYGKFEEFVK